MEFSIGRLFEMIEERFGRRAATGVLALVTLAVSAVSIGLTFAYLVSPVLRWVSRLIERGSIPTSVGLLLIGALWAAMFAGAIIVGSEVSNRVAHHRLIRLLAETMVPLEKLEAGTTKIDEKMTSLGDLLNEFGESVEKAHQRLDVIEGHLGIDADIRNESGSQQ